MDYNKCVNSKIKLVGKTLELKFDSYGEDSITTDIQTVGGKLCSHSFMTTEGIKTLNDNLIIITKEQVADIYQIVLSRQTKEYSTEFVRTIEFNSIDDLMLKCCWEFQIEKRSEWFEIYSENEEIKNKRYYITEVSGRNFSKDGPYEEDTSGYIIEWTDVILGNTNGCSDMYFVSDSGQKSEYMERMELSADVCYAGSSEYVIDMGHYSMLVSGFDCTFAGHCRLQFQDNIDIDLIENSIAREYTFTAVHILRTNCVLEPLGGIIEVPLKQAFTRGATLRVEREFDGKVHLVDAVIDDVYYDEDEELSSVSMEAMRMRRMQEEQA